MKKANGPTTEEQITHSFNNALSRRYDLVILGNSRLYRGINPDKFQIPSYNFSHDNDTYNQLYYKLEWLEAHHKNIKYLILGIDYFQFSILSDSRNYVYGDFLGENYLKDYESKNYKLENWLSTIHPNKIRFLFHPKEKLPYIKENGQYLKYGVASEGDKPNFKFNMLDIQKRYFEKIVKLCREKNVKIFLCMLPYRDAVLNKISAKDKEQFDHYISTFAKDVVYLNYSKDPNYKIQDYTDISHLSEEASDRFSVTLNDTINQILKISIN